MKTKIFLSILALGVIVSALGQNTLELTFTAIDSADYVQLDSIKVMNRTQGGDTVLFYPDTVLVLDYQVGISETNISTKGFQLFQNYPNPVIDQTTVSFYVPERDKVSLIATDMLGRIIIRNERTLDRGFHSCQFTPGNGSLFLFTVQWRESSSSIKILQTNSVSNNTRTLEYLGSEDMPAQLKATEDIQNFLFNLGDELLYIGYIDTLQSGMLDAPEESEIYTFQFATNIPCPGTPTVEYEGQVYNTIQILSQCWLKENLNVGTMIQGSQEMIDNDTIEKYCYNNDSDSCTKYGGLYQWDEMMQYTTDEGTQGICPPGWHIPDWDQWKILAGAVDSQYGIDWDWTGPFYIGFDAGLNLKTTNGWNEEGNGTNLFGFSGMPSGKRNNNNPYFDSVGDLGRWLTSSYNPIYNSGTSFSLWFDESGIRMEPREPKSGGFSVRCIKN